LWFFHLTIQFPASREGFRGGWGGRLGLKKVKTKGKRGSCQRGKGKMSRPGGKVKGEGYCACCRRREAVNNVRGKGGHVRGKAPPLRGGGRGGFWTGGDEKSSKKGESTYLEKSLTLYSLIHA